MPMKRKVETICFNRHPISNQEINGQLIVYCKDSKFKVNLYFLHDGRSAKLFIHQKLSSLGREIIRALRGTPGEIPARKSYFSQIRKYHPLAPKYQILFCRDLEINTMDHTDIIKTKKCSLDTF